MVQTILKTIYSTTLEEIFFTTKKIKENNFKLASRFQNELY